MKSSKSLTAAATVALALLVAAPVHSEARTITKKVCKTVKGKKTSRFVKVKVKAAKAADTTVVKAADTTVAK